MEDRRFRIRYKVRWPVTLMTSEGTIEGETLNLNANGAFIRCGQPLSPGERLLLTMELPASTFEEISTAVVWSNFEDSDEETRPRGMGIRFLW